jgi:lysophospholipase L1-like esterase
MSFLNRSVVRVFSLVGVLLALSMEGGLLAADVPKVHLAGDSTMADKPVAPPNPEHGWGQLFPRYFREPAMIVNHAQNGRSTKSFIAEGRWQTLVDALRPGDWAIIQFGHNDQKVEDPTRYAGPDGGFRENLRRFVQEVRAKGATPILAPPVARRRWNDAGQLVDTHGAYPDAVRALAQELAVPLLELNRLTTELEEAHGVEGSKRLHLWIPSGVYERKPDGYQDDTHYSAYGADRVAALAVQEILRLGLPLAEWLK